MKFPVGYKEFEEASQWIVDRVKAKFPDVKVVLETFDYGHTGRLVFRFGDVYTVSLLLLETRFLAEFLETAPGEEVLALERDWATLGLFALPRPRQEEVVTELNLRIGEKLFGDTDERT